MRYAVEAGLTSWTTDLGSAEWELGIHGPGRPHARIVLDSESAELIHQGKNRALWSDGRITGRVVNKDAYKMHESGEFRVPDPEYPWPRCLSDDAANLMEWVDFHDGLDLTHIQSAKQRHDIPHEQYHSTTGWPRTVEIEVYQGRLDGAMALFLLYSRLAGEDTQTVCFITQDKLLSAAERDGIADEEHERLGAWLAALSLAEGEGPYLREAK